MVFSSLLFILVFLPLNLICYYIPKNLNIRNYVLLIFSLLFYAWGEPIYVIILIAMSYACWYCARRIDASGNKHSASRWMMLAVIICLGTLGIFKYTGFFVQNLNIIPKIDIPVPDIKLPIGISFYTFQLLTYIIDVYRQEVPAQKLFRNVLLYAGLYHQCVAGPIIRYADIEKELRNRKTTLDSIYNGFLRFIYGLAKKSVLANSCGALVDMLLLSENAIGDPLALTDNLQILAGRSAMTLWFGMAFYMLQIYLDFSAYSDMAIGLGLMFGFHFKENFIYPYTSGSITEFWRRWHISLGSFFRDYVYIPLGGNRKGKLRTYLNMFIVWGLTGFWHGASWNFVLWGLYFFIFLAIEKMFLGKFLQKRKHLRHIYVIIVVYFGWVFFRFTQTDLMLTVLKGMFCGNGNSFATFEFSRLAVRYILFFVICCVACTPVISYVKKTLIIKGRKIPRYAKAIEILEISLPCILLIISVISLTGDTYNPFLYFQF